MIKATARTPDGRHLLLLGLSARNVEQLQAGNPIYFDTAALRLPQGEAVGHVAIVFGVSEAAITEAISPLIGKLTVVDVIPRGSEEPQ